jgi:HEAT repeat protein
MVDNPSAGDQTWAVDELFDVFRDTPFEIERCREAVAKLVALPAEEPVSSAARAFLLDEKRDEVRTWAINVLRARPDAETFATLLKLLHSQTDPDVRHASKFCRLYGLQALTLLADTPEREKKISHLLAERYPDEDDDGLPRAFAAAVCTLQGKRDARLFLEQRFERAKQEPSWYWPLWALLRAFEEVEPGPPDGPLASLVRTELIEVVRDDKGYIENRHRAMRVLARFAPKENVVRGIGEILVSNANEFLRLQAAVTLGKLQDRAAARDLVSAITDSNAEIRVQSALALERCVGTNDAIVALVDAAMESKDSDREITCVVEALRMLDPDRTQSSERLAKVLGGEDRDRAKCAERMLLDLGGWTAVQQLTQRRATLEQLDHMLGASEKVVQQTFERTIRQAQANFYFALGVNVLVVLAGVVLMGIAVSHLVDKPEDLGAWLLPGGTGVLVVVLNLYFNNPRQNAREDLAALVNTNMLFLGFLRQLNQIDATFKHAYIEKGNFDSHDMEVTVGSIQRTVERSLDMAAVHLRFRDRSATPSATVAERPEDIEQTSAQGDGAAPSLAAGATQPRTGVA